MGDVAKMRRKDTGPRAGVCAAIDQPSDSQTPVHFTRPLTERAHPATHVSVAHISVSVSVSMDTPPHAPTT